MPIEINSQICEANNLVPPLGILAVGSFLEIKGYEVQLIDEDIFASDFSECIVRFHPDIVGISFLTPTYTRAREIIRGMRPLPLIRLAVRILESNIRELPLPYRLTYAVTSHCQAGCRVMLH